MYVIEDVVGAAELLRVEDWSRLFVVEGIDDVKFSFLETLLVGHAFDHSSRFFYYGVVLLADS